MQKPFLSLFFVSFIVYCIYIMVSSSPLVRIDRVCAPVTSWIGVPIVAAIRTASGTPAAMETQKSFDDAFNTCRKWVWNGFYEDEYQTMKKAREAAPPKP